MAGKYIRKLQRVSTHSYSINIPKELVDEFGWRERQKLELSFGGRKPEIVITDWKKPVYKKPTGEKLKNLSIKNKT